MPEREKIGDVYKVSPTFIQQRLELDKEMSELKETIGDYVKMQSPTHIKDRFVELYALASSGPTRLNELIKRAGIGFQVTRNLKDITRTEIGDIPYITKKMKTKTGLRYTTREQTGPGKTRFLFSELSWVPEAFDDISQTAIGIKDKYKLW